MDGYLVCFCLGTSGLALMALGGLGGRHAGRDNDVGSASLPGADGHAAGGGGGLSGSTHGPGAAFGHGHGGALGHGHAHGGGLGHGHAHGGGLGHAHGQGGALGHGQAHGGTGGHDGALGHGHAHGSALGHAHGQGGGGGHAQGNGAAPTHALANGGGRGEAGGGLAQAMVALRPARGAGRSSAPGGRGFARGLLAWLSPRVLFSVLVGFGATGLLARHHLAGAWLFAAALAGGFGFERLIVGPFWNFLLGFGSRPARTLDSALFEEARAVTNFDARGEGLIALELDGHFVQVLGTLRADQRGPGPRVRAGDRLLVEEVDAARNRCTVSRG